MHEQNVEIVAGQLCDLHFSTESEPCRVRALLFGGFNETLSLATSCAVPISCAFFGAEAHLNVAASREKEKEIRGIFNISLAFVRSFRETKKSERTANIKRYRRPFLLLAIFLPFFIFDDPRQRRLSGRKGR